MIVIRSATCAAVGMLVALCPLAGPVGPRVACAGTPDTVRFNRDIQPILSDNCFPCHGPDALKREADLRLDVRESALAEREGIRAIIPGDIDHSELVRRTRSSDPAYRMPPPASNHTLSASEIEMLTRWVAQGAEYEPHWAYMPVRRPEPPQVQQSAWIQNPIDRFILAALEPRGVRPAPDADRRTLIRRLSFDLIGLPPTPAEVDAFARADAATSYADQVDALLASPHYGERMAMYWLDLVRYADTNGYNEDQHRNIHPYRDYVIRAFNDNLPFDQFTIEQLAGDLLPDPTLWQRVASGYNRLNKVSTENGSQEKEFLAVYAADRVRTSATVWMGATLGCAECHDHKFDPYTSRDFYRFAAFFADIDERGVPSLGRIALPPEMAVPASDDVAAELAEMQRRLTGLRLERSAAFAQDRRPFEEWLVAAPKAATDIVHQSPPFLLSEWTHEGAHVSIDADGSLLLESAGDGGIKGLERTLRTAAGNSEWLLDVATLRFSPAAAGRVELLDWKLREAQGMAELSVAVQPSPDRTIELTVAQGADTRMIDLGPVDDISALQLRVTWLAAPRLWSFSYGVNGEHPSTPLPGGFFSDTSVAGAQDGWSEAIRAISLLPAPLEGQPQPPPTSATLAARIRGEVVRRPDVLGDPPAEIATLRALPAAERNATHLNALETYYASAAPQFATWNNQIDEIEARKRVVESALTTTLVSVARPPRVTRILHRGDWQDEQGEIVQPAVPAFLPPVPSDTRADRLALARWLTQRDNPLTARVLANRLWKLFFGHGIARTLDDLGSQGARPTHPDLLDWLASELMDSGWDVKRLIRTIVTSHTYQQSSAERPDLHDIDPDNQLFARQSAFRLDAEMIRDNALAVSALLSRRVGGPSVKPYQPKHYWDGVSKIIPRSPSAGWRPSSGEDQYRRGLYTYWKRTFLHPSLLAFDAPTREECIAERTRSNTPLQALVLLNDPTYVEAARALAERAAAHGGATAEGQLRWAYQQTLSQDPDDETLAILQELYDEHRQEYAKEPQAARLIITAGQAPPPAARGIVDRLAALTSVCRVLFNLSETITRY